MTSNSLSIPVGIVVIALQQWYQSFPYNAVLIKVLLSLWLIQPTITIYDLGPHLVAMAADSPSTILCHSSFPLSPGVLAPAVLVCVVLSESKSHASELESVCANRESDHSLHLVC